MEKEIKEKMKKAEEELKMMVSEYNALNNRISELIPLMQQKQGEYNALNSLIQKPEKPAKKKIAKKRK